MNANALTLSDKAQCASPWVSMLRLSDFFIGGVVKAFPSDRHNFIIDAANICEVSRESVAIFFQGNKILLVDVEWRINNTWASDAKKWQSPLLTPSYLVSLPSSIGDQYLCSYGAANYC